MKKNSKAPTAIPASRRSLGWNLGAPLSADDVRRLANKARVKLVSNVDFELVAEELNSGLHLFAGAAQEVSTPGEFEGWFRKISKRADATLVLFGAAETSEREQAIRNFIERPLSWKAANFDPFKLAEILNEIEKLSATASIAAGRIKKGGHRQRGSPRSQLEAAFRAAWQMMTGADHPTVTKSGGGPDGPFIRFASAVLLQAADELAGARRASARAAAPKVRTLAGQPHNIAEWAGIRGKLLAKK